MGIHTRCVQRTAGALLFFVDITARETYSLRATSQCGAQFQSPTVGLNYRAVLKLVFSPSRSGIQIG